MHKGSQDLNNRKGIIAFQAELRKELKDGDGHAFGQKASIYKQTIQDIDSVSSDTNCKVNSVFLRKCNINFFPSNAFLRRRRKKALLRVNDRGGGWKMCILALCRVCVCTRALMSHARLQLTYVAMAILRKRSQFMI